MQGIAIILRYLPSRNTSDCGQRTRMSEFMRNSAFGLQYLLVVLVLLALATTDTNAYQDIEQNPEGDKVTMGVNKTKVTFKVRSDQSDFDAMKLRAKVGPFYYQENTNYIDSHGISVRLQDCTDSDDPSILCKKVQVSLFGRDHGIESIAFDLLDENLNSQLLKTVQVVMPVPSQTDPTESSSTSPQDISDAGSNTGTLPFPVGLVGYGIAALLLFLLVVETIVLVVVFKCRKAPSNKVENAPV